MHPIKRFLMKHLSHEQQLALRRVKNVTVAPLQRFAPARRTAYPPAASFVDPTRAQPNSAEAARCTKASGSLNYGLASDETSLGLLWPWNYEISRLPRRLPSGKRWPKISVVTVTYNQGAFLEETIRSVLLQGYPNLEYIVIDGGSTDNTRHILERYREDLSVVISEPDRGQSDALNKGFSRATGDILAWLNSDDQYFPDTLRKVAETFDRFETDLVVGGTTLITEFSRQPTDTHHCVFPLNQATPLPLEQLADFEGEWQRGKFFYQPEVFWTRTLWERCGARVEDKFRYAMDYELWLRFAANAARVVHVPDDFAIFRLHNSQRTKWRAGENYPEHVAVGQLYAGAALVGSTQAAAGSRPPDVTGPIRIQDTIPKSVFDQRPLTLGTTSAGLFYVPADGIQDEACRTIRAGGIYRREVIEKVAEFARPGTIVLDVGAGVGQAAIILSRNVGASGQVFAFEADEYLFDILLRNRDANRAENVRAFHGAVSDGSRRDLVFPKLEYLRFPSYSTQRVDPNATSGRRIPAFDLDSLAIQGPVSVLHVHAPGSELAVLKGAKAVIQRNRMPVVLELDEDLQAEFGHSPAHLASLLEELDYRVAETIHTSTHLLLPLDWQAMTRAMAPEPVLPEVKLSPAEFRRSLCKILRSWDQVDECTRWLKRNGFVSHNLTCKDWDLAHIVPEIGDGNFLDMGSSDSYVLKNVCIKRTRGDKYGIDFQQSDVPLSDVKYKIGDLMDTRLPASHFSYITCLSVLEHQVDYERFAAEVSRLLGPGGRLFVTFDYWEPQVTPPVKLYGLDWQLLDAARARKLFEACAAKGLRLEQDFDWTLGDPVIRWGYYSPHPDVSYTFALASFRKD